MVTNKSIALVAMGALCVVGFCALVVLTLGSSEGGQVTLLSGSDGSTTSTVRATTSTITTTSSTTTTTSTLPPRADPSLHPPTANGALDGHLIVVDPGHNGENFEYSDVLRPGTPHLCNTTGTTATNGVFELEINWAVGQELKSLLNAMGAAVLLTHEDNDGFGPCADERGELARDNDVTAFVSIHADGSNTGGSGFHVIHPAEHKILDPDSVLRSQVLASSIRDELLFVGARPANYLGTNGIQERGDLVNLNSADTAAVLVEMGNLRNPFDARLLTETTSQRVIAAALARGVLRSLGLPTDDIVVRGDMNLDGFPDFLQDYSTTTTTTTTTTTQLGPTTTTKRTPTTTTTVTTNTSRDTSTTSTDI